MASRALKAEDGWDAIHAPHVSLHLEESVAPVSAWVATLLSAAPFTLRAEGDIVAVLAGLRELPDELLASIERLAGRFGAVMGCGSFVVRVEAITGDACRTVHADYAEVRLIQTLAGPGTDHAPDGHEACGLERVPTGWIGLFKGRCYPGASDGRHAPCLHRSPPVAGTGERRLVLVIDMLRAA
jgi:hypothetical protein